MGLLDDIASKAQQYAAALRDQIPTVGGLLAPVDNARRVVAKNIGDLLANPSDYLNMVGANAPQTIAEQGAGLAPGGSSALGVLAKGNFPAILYRGTMGYANRITGGIGEGLLFASPQESIAKLYGPNIEKIGVNPDANILIEGSKEFSKVTGRRMGKIINNMRQGENLKSAADDVISRAKANGYDAVDFNSMKDMGTAILNPSMFARNQ